MADKPGEKDRKAAQEAIRKLAKLRKQTEATKTNVKKRKGGDQHG